MRYGIYSKKHSDPDSEWELALVAKNRVLGNIVVSFLADEAGQKFDFDIREMEG